MALRQKQLGIDEDTHLAIKRRALDSGLSMIKYLRQIFVEDRRREALEALETQLREESAGANTKDANPPKHGETSTPPPQP